MANYIEPNTITELVTALSNDGELSKQDVNYLIRFLSSKGDLSGSPRDMIQIRRGLKKDLPRLLQGELGYALDTKELFTGGLDGNDNVLESLLTNGVLMSTFPRFDNELDDTERIKRAISYAKSIGGNTILFDEVLYTVKQIELESNLTFISHVNSEIKSLDFEGIGVNQGTFYWRNQPNNLDHLHVYGITFNGNKDNISERYFHIFSFDVANDTTVSNIIFDNCTFKDSKEDSIRILGTSNSSIVTDVTINNCRFYGRKEEYVGYSGNALRVLYRNYSVSNYGTYFARNIHVTNCYAEHIRTLSDLKRGVEQFIVYGNITKNIYDIDHSTDGSRFGVYMGNITLQDVDFNPIDGANAFELQSIDLIVIGNNIQRKRVNGILISDYGHPSEGNVGHRSKNVLIANNLIGEAILGGGVKSVNSDNVRITNNHIEKSVSPIIVDEGGNKTNETGQPLKAGKSYVADNSFGIYQYGIIMKGSYPVLGGGNTGAQIGFEIQYAGSPNMMVEVDTRNFNYNPILRIVNDKIEYWETGENVVLASSKPLGSLHAVTIQDTSTTNIQSITNTGFDIPAKIGEVIHVGIDVLKGTASNMGLIFAEYNGSTFIKNMFVTLDPTAEWTRKRANYKVTDSSCNNVKVSINPATGINYPQATGTNHIANLVVAKYPVN